MLMNLVTHWVEKSIPIQSSSCVHSQHLECTAHILLDSTIGHCEQGDYFNFGQIQISVNALMTEQ